MKTREVLFKKVKNWLKAFTHNCIVHPLMMFVPRSFGDKMHDRNANWAFSLNRYDELSLERRSETEDEGR